MKMEFGLTDTQRDIQKGARKFAEKEFDSKIGRDLDKDGKFPKSIFEKACRLGWVGIDYPEEYGGQSFGLFEKVLVIEEFCRRDSGIGISISLADMASGIILRHGNEQQKKRFLMPLLEEKGINTVADNGFNQCHDESGRRSIWVRCQWEEVLCRKWFNSHHDSPLL